MVDNRSRAPISGGQVVDLPGTEPRLPLPRLVPPKAVGDQGQRTGSLRAYSTACRHGCRPLRVAVDTDPTKCSHFAARSNLRFAPATRGPGGDCQLELDAPRSEGRGERSVDPAPRRCTSLLTPAQAQTYSLIGSREDGAKLPGWPSRQPRSQQGALGKRPGSSAFGSEQERDRGPSPDPRRRVSHARRAKP
jgi:hypothetical protein